MEHHFYQCNVTIQSALGPSSVFITYAIATSVTEAVGIANRSTEQVLPAGWTIVGTFAAALKNELLEEVAERVLGWHRP
jgi:hypothetical protein